MKRKSLFYVVMSLFTLLSLGLSACQKATPTAAPVAQPTATTAPTEVAFEPMSVSAPDCSYGGKIKEIAAVDELTVKFSLCKPDPAFMAKVAFIPFNIQPKEWIDK
ncbi:MAG: hypothetical protein ACK2UI_08665, partial [Anaerolineae bacterium]